jgi:hypothetical protein
MKKLILVFFASLVTGITMGQINFGVKGGLNIATIKIKYGHTANHLTDFHAGGLARLKFSEDVALQAELVYSRQGMKTKTFTGNIPYEDRLSYINAPVLVQYLAESGFHFHTGPQFSFLLNAKTTQPGVDTDKSDYYKKFDFAWVAGAGHLTRIGLGVDVRVNFSLINMAEPEGASLRQTVWQFGLFYQFK